MPLIGFQSINQEISKTLDMLFFCISSCEAESMNEIPYDLLGKILDASIMLFRASCAINSESTVSVFL
jgi:hypothetical protein